MSYDIIIKTQTKRKRPLQVGKEIRRILVEILSRNQVSDPILFDRTIIISDVFVSNDLSLAKVYVSSLGQSISQDKLLKALNKYAGFFKGKIGKRLNIRVIPKLIFLNDDQFDKLEEVEEMFKKISKEGE